MMGQVATLAAALLLSLPWRWRQSQGSLRGWELEQDSTSPFERQGPFRFLDLPRPIRGQIYLILLNEDKVAVQKLSPTSDNGKRIRHEERRPDKPRLKGYRRPFIHCSIECTEEKVDSKNPDAKGRWMRTGRRGGVVVNECCSLYRTTCCCSVLLENVSSTALPVDYAIIC